MLKAVAAFEPNSALTPGQVSGAGGVIILGNQGLPMVMPGSGLMAANGVGTLTTALAGAPAITNCYAYFALNAIATGVPAGWYYTVFSTTTAFIVYNNTYTIGTPVIPASPTPFVTTSPVSYTGASGAIAAYQLSIPGNTLGLNGGLRVSYTGSFTNSAANKTYALSYGAFSFGLGALTTDASLQALWGFKNAGATGAQFPNYGSGSSTGLILSTAAIFGGTVDSTAAQTFAVTMTNATPATNNMVLCSTTIELLPSVA